MSNTVIFLVETQFHGKVNADQAFVDLQSARVYGQGLVDTATNVYNLRPFKISDEKKSIFEGVWDNDSSDSVIIRRINLQQ